MIDGYATHQEALAFAFACTGGAVVELGAGWYSTPLLHGLCEATMRELWTVEADLDWARQFIPWSNKWHRLIVDSAVSIPAGIEDIGIVLVDHNQYPGAPGRDGPSRGMSIRAARERGADIIVCHDSNMLLADGSLSSNYTGYQGALDEFPHRRDWTNFLPWTTALSDTLNIEEE